MMKTSYDPEADAFYGRFAPDNVVINQTIEVAPSVNIDIDAQGQMIGIEALSVKLRAAGAYGDKAALDAAE